VRCAAHKLCAMGESIRARPYDGDEIERVSGLVLRRVVKSIVALSRGVAMACDA
jgi:hypothetical protein